MRGAYNRKCDRRVLPTPITDRPMRHHVLPAVAAAIAIVGFAACQDVSAPAPAPATQSRAISPSVQASLSKSGSAVVPVLERNKPIKDGVSASADIGLFG